MWVFDTETLRFLAVNAAAVAKYGFSRDEFLARTIDEIRRPEDVPAVLADVRTRKPPGLRGPALWRHRCKDGTVLQVQVTSEDTLFDGRPARLVMAQDLGEAERHASEIHEKHRFLQSILDGMPAVVFVKDLESRFTLVNEAWEQFTGCPREKAIGKKAHDLFPADVADRIRRDDLQAFGAITRTETEEVVPGARGPQTQLTSRFSLRDDEGRPNGLVGLAVDISERKRSEEQQARLSRVVEQASESIIITDPQGTMIYVNPAFERISGYSAAEAVGENPRVLKSGHQDVTFYRRMWETLARGEVWKGRMVNRRKDGTLYQEDATIGPVRDASGRIVNYVAVKHDVTNEMRLERQLMQAQKMEAVGRLAGGVAHDFNNLLGVITGYGEMTLRKLRAEDPLKAKVDEILKAAERAAGLTRQLLAFSRQQVLQPRIVDLNDLVGNVEKMLRRLIGEDIRLTTSLDPVLGSVKADPGQLEQVLMNLAVNARDAMPDGGRLTIATQDVELGPEEVARHPPTRPGLYVLLAVTDSGTGMDAETQSHLFEPFFTTKEMGKGTGLGLSTVYGIVKQSGGYIWCESEVGSGTTFRIYLPRIDEDAPSARRPAPPRLAHGSETVLLVEDDPSLRDLVSEILEGAGYTVLVADDGARALRIAEEYAGPIHIIVTDVIMPGETGRRTAEAIKAVRSEVEILYMSGYTTEAIEKHGVLSPGARFLGKPFTTEDLLRKVRDILDHHWPSAGSAGPAT
jgi:PAS domain S-box-containing protein